MNLNMEQQIAEALAVCDLVRDPSGLLKSCGYRLTNGMCGIAPALATPSMVTSKRRITFWKRFTTSKMLVGGILNTLVRNANRVKIVCLAQFVNVIAPIMTNSKGSLRQTILYPYRFALQFARCNVLSLLVRDRPCSILGCCRYPRTEKSRASS